MMETFERIVLEYQDKIFRLTLSFLRDRAAAEETTQDVLLRIWKGLSPRRSNVRHRRIGGVENITH